MLVKHLATRRPEALMTDISLRFEPPFARIVLSRPERRNAITRAMWRALPAIRAAIEAREDLLVTLVEGEGAHFSAGADIAELGDIYRDAAATRDFGDAMQNGLKALMDIDRPTIAIIRGVAIGAGAWPGARLRSEVLRRRRAPRHYPRETRPDLRPCRDAPAGRTHRPVARQGSSVHRAPDRDR
jgi:Enoyl-CoA hydratase/isomerase